MVWKNILTWINDVKSALNEGLFDHIIGSCKIELVCSHKKKMNQQKKKN